MYRVYVLYDILECGVGAEEGKQRPLVEKCVDKVRVAVKSVTKARVDDLENHADHFLQYTQVLHLNNNKKIIIICIYIAP